MAVAALDGSRRRSSGLHPPRDAGAGLYSFAERADGFRIENPFRRPVDLRVDGWFIVATGGKRVARLPLLDSPLHLSRVVASLLLGVPDSLARPISPALRRESWAIAQDLKDHRRRLLERHHPVASAVEELMLQIRGDVPRLAATPAFYRARYISGDVIRFRAAAIALAYVDTALWSAVRDGPPKRCPIRVLVARMARWRDLFSPTGASYRSLDRTLMNLPDGVPPRLVCELRSVKLERPLTSRPRLVMVLECAARWTGRGAHNESRLRVLQHASEDSLCRAIDQIGRGTGRALDPGNVEHLLFAAGYVSDAPPTSTNRIESLVAAAIRWHEQIGRVRGQWFATNRLPEYGAETPTAQPPAPLPDLAGIAFLDTVAAIVAEGQRMRHCVAIYAGAAVRGRCFLFHVDHAGQQATVEVTANGWIRQAVGPANRHNTAVEWGRVALDRWAARWRRGTPPVGR